MSHIFISYSRKDLDFAQKIVDTLAANDLDTWIDWKDIPPAEEWLQEIYQGIEGANAFLFLISPDSLASRVCNLELEHAVKNGKRIIPIIIRDPDSESVPESLSKLNWIFYRHGQDDLEKANEKICKTIRTNYKWANYHTRLQVKALEWSGKKIDDLLLRGKELREAEKRLAENYTDPQPTDEQRNYLLESQKYEKRKRIRTALVLSIGLIVVAISALVARRQSDSAIVSEATAQAERSRADEQSKISFARRLANPAQLLFQEEYSDQLIPVLLATQSMKAYPSVEAAQILQTHILAAPTTQLKNDNSVLSIAFSPDGMFLISGSSDGTARIWDVNAGQEVSRRSHDDEVGIVAVHPSGKWVASGSDDGAIQIWETSTGDLVSQFMHDSAVHDLAFSPDGMQLVSGSSDGTARVWNVFTGEELSRMVYNSFVATVAFSPDGKWVASGGCDEFDVEWACRSGSARVWEAKTGRELSRVDYGYYVLAIAFSPDGSWVVAGVAPWGNNLQIWEASTGKVVSTMSSFHKSGVWTVAFSPDGNWVAAGGCDKRSGMKTPCYEGSARVWDSTTGEEVALLPHAGDVQTIEFSPDGKLIASGGNDGLARVWQVNKNQEIAQLPHEGIILSVTFSPDGNRVASAGSNAIIRMWNLSENGTNPRQISDDKAGYRSSVSFSPDGKWVASDRCDQRLSGFSIPICASNKAHVWEVSTGQEVSSISHNDEISAIAFNPDGQWVASGGRDGVILIWQSSTGHEQTRLLHDEEVSSIVFSPDGNLIASGSADSTARIWNAKTGDELFRMRHDDAITSIAFNPSGDQILTGSKDSTLRLWNTFTGKEITLMLHDAPVTSIAFSPDGKMLLSGSEDGTARIWDAITGEEISRMVHSGKVNDVAFIPDSNWVVSISDDRTARVWDAATGDEIVRVNHEYAVRVMAVSEDGKWIVTGEEQRPFTGAISVDEAKTLVNSTIRVWETSSGKEIARMTHDNNFNNSVGIPGGIRSVAFSPDGKWIVSADEVGYVIAWLYRPEDLIDYACKHLPRNFTLVEWKQYNGENIPYQITCDPAIYPNAMIPEDAQAYLDSQ